MRTPQRISDTEPGPSTTEQAIAAQNKPRILMRRTTRAEDLPALRAASQRRVERRPKCPCADRQINHQGKGRVGAKRASGIQTGRKKKKVVFQAHGGELKEWGKFPLRGHPLDHSALAFSDASFAFSLPHPRPQARPVGQLRLRRCPNSTNPRAHFRAASEPRPTSLASAFLSSGTLRSGFTC